MQLKPLNDIDLTIEYGGCGVKGEYKQCFSKNTWKWMKEKSRLLHLATSWEEQKAFF